jgi:putative hydrolase of the HAD superfamily
MGLESQMKRKEELENAIIFDGDDTLWENQVFYDEAKEEFFAFMANHGYEREKVAKKLSEVDIQNVNKFGFSRKRFPTSMKETAEFFIGIDKGSIDPQIINNVTRIGNSVFERKPILMDGAKEVLERLRDNYVIFLYSGGDFDVQINKVNELGLKKYFKKIYITSQKDETQLGIIIKEQHLNKKETWMVGNSLKSDILPALNLGINCIWIQTKSWAYDQIDHDISPVHQIHSLKEILEFSAIFKIN